MKSPEEVDECTLYVEQIPINSTHESLKELFSRFGKVVYVSLPRYQKSRQLKQFAFVEFENKESIIKAINTFKRCDNVLQYAIVKAENLLSIATHEKESTSEKTEEKMEQEKSAEEKVENVEESDEPPLKKLKVATDDEETETENPEESGTEASKASEKETEDEEGKHEGEDGANKKKKKNRKHKKKPKSNSLVDEHVLAMRIMRKKDWKKMRNEYLNLERQKAKEIKKILRESYNKRNISKIQEGQKFSPLNTESPRINFYGSPNDREERFEANTSETPETNQSSSGLTFIPGVIVNIKFREPCSEFKELKKEFKQFPYVNFVDILEGGSQCYIRVENSASAVELVGQYSSCEYETEVLKDEPEKEYWKKIFEKRDAQKNSSQAPHKPAPRITRRRRGRERLVEKIQKIGNIANAASGTHVRFEDVSTMVIAEDSMGMEWE